MSHFKFSTLSAFLLSFILGNVGIAFAEPNLQVTALTLSGMSRIDRFIYELNYRATVTNTGSQANAVTANLVVNNSATTVMGANQLTFGDVTANSTKQSTNTVKLRHDRRTQLKETDFNWTFQTGGTTTNQAPQVNAGLDQTITLPATANFNATVTDDGLPNPPAAVSVTWTKVSGPGTVTFSAANAKTTTATFSVVGTYVLRLTANDGELSSNDEIRIGIVQAEVGVITPEGGSVTLEGVAKVTFPAGAFTTNTQVTVSTSSDSAVARSFNSFAAIFRPVSRLPYEVRINTGSQRPVSDAIRVEIIVPNDFLNAVPAGYQIEFFARLLSTGGLSILESFDLFDADFDVTTKSIVYNNLSTAMFSDTWNSAGDFEAIVTLAPTPGINRPIPEDLQQSYSVTPKAAPAPESCIICDLECPVGICKVDGEFREPRPNGTLHQGVDYGKTQNGIEVRAAVTGVIHKKPIGSANLGCYGNVIEQDHNGTIRYAHLASFASNIVDGVSVNAGTIIGTAGNTGCGNIPVHLHLEFIPSVDGQLKARIDPEKCRNNKLTIEPSALSLNAKPGETKTESNKLIATNNGQNNSNFELIWNPKNEHVTLNPMSGNIPSQNTKSISTTLQCPAPPPSTWDGKVQICKDGGKNYDGNSVKVKGLQADSSIKLSCTCQDCCGHCCAEGENPPNCGCPTANKSANLCTSDSWGDPHLTTFDKLAYNFQGVGEFILVKSIIPNDTFEVQVRNRPLGSGTSVTSAVAMKTGTDRVGFYAGINTPLYVNGVPTQLAAGGEIIALPSGASIARSGNNYSVSGTDGSIVDFQGSGSLHIKVHIPEAKSENIIGLLGDANGNTENDVTIRNGNSLGTHPKFSELYPGYADSWRITEQESLFDRAAGETTGTFTDNSLPRVNATTSSLTEDARTNAEQICQAAGITDPVLLDNCILDVALTGDPSFATLPTDIVVPTTTVEIIPPPLPTINDPGFGQFKGTVLNAITNQPVASGQVLLTQNGLPVPQVVAHTISNGGYTTDVVPIDTGYQLDITADGYIAEKVFNLTALDRQLLQVDSIKLIPTTANGVGTITGHIGNALNNNNVPNLNVSARRYINQRAGEPVKSAITDANGNFTLDALTTGNYTLEIHGTGFITKYLPVINIGGQTNSVDEIVTPELGASQFRVVLTWGENPSDLDSHLTGPNGNGGRFHVYYGNRGNSDLEIAPYTYLDRDDTSSFGPETTTIGHLLSTDVYRYSVYNYSGGAANALAQSNAKVEVYGDNNRLLATFNVPNQEGRMWTVFEINQAGAVVPVNQVSNETNPRMQSSAERSQSSEPVTDYWQMLFQPSKN